MESKKPWQSKTNWVALLVAAAAFFPPVSDFISANPEAFSAIVGGIFLVLRQISGDKISIK
jgi:hypothetical protein